MKQMCVFCAGPEIFERSELQKSRSAISQLEAKNNKMDMTSHSSQGEKRDFAQYSGRTWQTDHDCNGTLNS